MGNVLINEDYMRSAADAIRTKKSSTAGILAENFAQEILSIPSGGSATLIDKTITENGEYVASDDGADGYSKIEVNVSGTSVTPITAKIYLQFYQNFDPASAKYCKSPVVNIFDEKYFTYETSTGIYTVLQDVEFNAIFSLYAYRSSSNLSQCSIFINGTRYMLFNAIGNAVGTLSPFKFDLSLKAGDTIRIVKEADRGWMIPCLILYQQEGVYIQDYLVNTNGNPPYRDSYDAVYKTLHNFSSLNVQPAIIVEDSPFE